jgi:beta-lactam-binding protein with PASTA domain
VTESPTDSWPTVDTIHGGPPAYAPPPPPPPEPDRRFGLGMLLALAAIALAAGGVAIAYFLTHRDNSPDVTTTFVTTSGTGAVGKTMPRLTGETLDAAKAKLAAFDIRPAVTPQTSNAPAGTVLAQAPEVGATLTRRTPVTLVVAQAKEQATTSTQATTTGATTTGATTTAPTTTAPTTTSPTTTASAPPAPSTATVPDVSSTTEAAAVQSLNRAGIVASLAFVPGSDPLGTVEVQAKQSGTTVPYHSHMQINISSGPGDKPKERVPNVIGRPLQQALSSINGARLRLLYLKFPVTSRGQAGKIVQQSPLGGAQAPQNAQVVVYLGAFSG